MSGVSPPKRAHVGSKRQGQKVGAALPELIRMQVMELSIQ